MEAGEDLPSSLGAQKLLPFLDLTSEGREGCGPADGGQD